MAKKTIDRKKASKSSRLKLMPKIEKKKFKRLESFSKKPLKRMSVKRLDSSEADAAREPRAEKLTRLMRKGYRKGYRVKSTRGGRR